MSTESLSASTHPSFAATLSGKKEVPATRRRFPLRSRNESEKDKALQCTPIEMKRLITAVLFKMNACEFQQFTLSRNGHQSSTRDCDEL